jgi:hypothetical protein
MRMNTSLPTPSDLWQTILAFVRFELFITPSFLIYIYWLGAVGLPLVTVIVVRKLLRHPGVPDIADLPVWQRSRSLVIAFGTTMFIFAELMWRMVIETVLAYFQMRDALIGAASL